MVVLGVVIVIGMQWLQEVPNTVAGVGKNCRKEMNIWGMGNVPLFTMNTAELCLLT